MGKTVELSPITALVAESDRTTRRAIQIYAETQTEVRLCAAVSTGQEMLDALRQGTRADVLVVDALLRDINIYSMLRQINSFDMQYHPCVIVTLVRAAAAQCEKLLTAGADCTIFKPYKVSELFDAVCTIGNTGEQLIAYCIRRSLHNLLGQMHFRTQGYGINYLEDIITRIILDEEEKRYTLSQLCIMAGEIHGAEGDAVRSALERFNTNLRRSCPEAYARLGQLKGIESGEHMTVSELLDALTICVRAEMNRGHG